MLSLRSIHQLLGSLKLIPNMRLVYIIYLMCICKLGGGGRGGRGEGGGGRVGRGGGMPLPVYGQKPVSQSLDGPPLENAVSKISIL